MHLFYVWGLLKNDGSSSTLVIVDEHGIGQVTLASGKQGIYRKEDGLILEITNETSNVIYQNVETIRKNNIFN